MHPEAFRFIEQSLNGLKARPKTVLEVGSKNINGTPRTLFPVGITYTGIDQVAGPDVDIVIDGAAYKPAAKSDLVICAEVLEHATDPEAVVKNALACVKRGGHVIVTCATTGRVPHSGIDGGTLRRGEPYRNIPIGELRDWLAGTKVISLQVFPERGDLYAFAKVTK
jgi:SAM-dependent methyltransferase